MLLSTQPNQLFVLSAARCSCAALAVAVARPPACLRSPSFPLPHMAWQIFLLRPFFQHCSQLHTHTHTLQHRPLGCNNGLHMGLQECYKQPAKNDASKCCHNCTRRVLSRGPCLCHAPCRHAAAARLASPAAAAVGRAAAASAAVASRAAALAARAAAAAASVGAAPAQQNHRAAHACRARMAAAAAGTAHEARPWGVALPSCEGWG